MLSNSLVEIYLKTEEENSKPVPVIKRLNIFSRHIGYPWFDHTAVGQRLLT